MRNTSIITVLTIIGSVISNPIIAYGFSRIEWPGRDQIFYLVLATVFIPFPVLIVALFDIFAKTPRPVLDGWQLAWEGNWINTYLPLVVPMFFGNAFWIFLMRQFMMQIPHEISDAARIDGASEFRIFYQIVLPQALPAIGVISIFAGAPRLERLPRPADLPPGRDQVHPLHRADLLPVAARDPVQPPHGGLDAGRPAGGRPLPPLPTRLRRGHLVGSVKG